MSLSSLPQTRKPSLTSLFTTLFGALLLGGLVLASPQTTMAAKKKAALPPSTTMLQHLTRQLSEASKAFLEARQHRRLQDPQLYALLQAYTNEVQSKNNLWSKVLKAQQPAAYKQLQWWLVSMNGLLYRLRTKKTFKGSDFTPEQGLYRFLQAAPTATAQQMNHPALTAWKTTFQTLNSTLLVERQVGPYRVGIRLRQAAPYYYWYTPGFRRSDRRIMVKPPRKATAMIEVVLRRKDTAQFLYGTDVSVELLGAKGKQLSSQRLIQVWRGFPVFNGFLVRPAVKLTAVQVTISASPLTRTQLSLQGARQSQVIRFPVIQKNGRFTFVKPTLPKTKTVKGKKVFVTRSEVVTAPVAPGRHILKGLQLIGGRVQEAGMYRVGIGFLPPQTLFHWNGRAMTARKARYFRNAQVVVFVQDRTTGAMIPGIRAKLMVYWSKKGENIREDVDLKPVLGEFPSYRKHIRLSKKYTYKVKLQVYPSLTARVQDQRPHAYSFVWEGVTLPASIRNPAKIIRKKRKPKGRK